MSRLPLEGIRVCDFSWLVAGPCATQMLAVMGAEVIKIESHVHTDLNRRGTPYLDGVVGVEQTGNFHRMNMSKKSCTLDLNKPEAAEIAKDIVRVSDIVVSNFRNGVMERFGLGNEALQKLKPDIILVSSTGMGNRGPNKDFVCYNEETYAFGGLGYLTGYQDKLPAMVVGDFADYMVGTIETFAILSALHYRSKTGRGQIIEVSMVDVVGAHIPEAIMDFSMNRRVQQRIGNHMDGMAPHNCFKCKGEDKWVAIAVTNDREWEALCHAMGDPKWTRGDKFHSALSRFQNQDELESLMGGWTINYTPEEAVDILQKAGVPAGPSLSIEELVKDPHLNECGFFVTPDHPVVGKRILEGMPWNMSDSKPVFEPAPLLGEDNDYVFRELLGMSDDKIAELIINEVIY